MGYTCARFSNARGQRRGEPVAGSKGARIPGSARSAESVRWIGDRRRKNDCDYGHDCEGGGRRPITTTKEEEVVDREVFVALPEIRAMRNNWRKTLWTLWTLSCGPPDGHGARAQPDAEQALMSVLAAVSRGPAWRRAKGSNPLKPSETLWNGRSGAFWTSGEGRLRPAPCGAERRQRERGGKDTT